MKFLPKTMISRHSGCAAMGESRERQVKQFHSTDILTVVILLMGVSNNEIIERNPYS